MCSRLGYDGLGRRIVVQTDESVGIRLGETFLLRGNDLRCVQDGVFWMGVSGRPPTEAERRQTRTPYRAPTYEPAPEPDDDELDEQAAIAAAYLEQRQQPADVVNVAA